MALTASVDSTQYAIARPTTNCGRGGVLDPPGCDRAAEVGHILGAKRRVDKSLDSFPAEHGGPSMRARYARQRNGLRLFTASN